MTLAEFGEDEAPFFGEYSQYWLDQKIWKPSTDARLRLELGLASAP